jgi:hypothetical protein
LASVKFCSSASRRREEEEEEEEEEEAFKERKKPLLMQLPVCRPFVQLRLPPPQTQVDVSRGGRYVVVVVLHPTGSTDT